ncbi:acyltransferase family protein [Lapidilactobacillus bayanensis]|uniref:acyltransferase family protein n=1 Tax=Lapidilactobacillus bayanensis TaxID=2485998 RepID=UPI000F7AD7AC|nr:acyltransferase [Lapidilactobacillus bayanensis]
MVRENKINYDMIDLLKFIAAICVVAIHSLPHDILGNDLRVFTRFSVPFFFIVSSYFLFKKITFKNAVNDRKRIHQYCLRVLKLYFYWLLIYTPYWLRSIKDIVQSDYTKVNGLWFIIKMSLGYVPTIGVTWYLMASIISVLITYYIRRFLGRNTLIIVMILSFLIGILTSTYGKWYFEIQSLKSIPIAGSISFSFLSTICYVILGYFLSKSGSLVSDEVKSKHFLMYFVVFSIIGFFEVYFAQSLGVFKDGQNFILLPLITISLFLFGINSQQRISMAPLLRKSSTIIYLAQNPVKFVIFAIARRLKVATFTYDNFFVFFVQLVVLMLICLVIVNLSQQKGFHWLANFY